MRCADVLRALSKYFNSPRPSGKDTRLYIIMVLSIFLAPFSGSAFEGDLETDLQSGLDRSRTIVTSIQKKLLSGASVSSEIIQLKSAAENIRVVELLLEERFKLRDEKVKSLGSKAVERQQAMTEGYKKALMEYLVIIDGLPSSSQVSGEGIQEKINSLKKLLDSLLPKKKRPILGTLPYKHPNYPAQEPNSAPPIIPAYKGGNKIVAADDTKGTPEAPISQEIAALAQSLNWNPVSIFEYIKNNVETEWYFGCMKGAEDTVHQKSGNDCDQATLLTALLRASGFPTRYVRGVIEFFPDIEGAKNLTGIEDPNKIAEYFQKAGVPYKLVIQGGKISNFQIEHVWVESQIPYANYRGTIIDEYGKTWLGLDTSIKVKGYAYNSAQDILSAMSLSTIRNEYLGLATAATPSTPFELNQSPLEYLQARINSEFQTQDSQLAYADFLRTRVLIPEVMNILPASTQFILVKATNEYTAIPDDLMHKLKLSAVNGQPSANNNTLFDIILPLYKLSNQQITISYEPETIQDQEIIDSYGGLDNTPAYLVHLRPVLKVNGERIVVAQDGLPMGGEFNLAIDLLSPNSTQSITNSHIVGNLSIIGITAQQTAITSSPLAGDGGGEGAKDASRLLYETAQHYIDRWNKAEDELASLLHLAVTRPIPTVVTLGGVIDVTSLMGAPHGCTWKGVYVDAAMRSVEAVQSSGTSTNSVESFGVQSDRQKLFMQLSSLQGSILENRIFEDDFKVESISTAKLFQFVNQRSGGTGQGSGQLTINKTNIDAILPTLYIDDNIKEDMANAVNQGFELRTPDSELVYQDWTGIGYLKENPSTGESGWMLSGMIAGGMTAWGKVMWPIDLQGILLNTITGSPNYDPASATYIQKLSEGDLQFGTVNTKLPIKLSVKVTDTNQKAVANVAVTFTVKAGNGMFDNAKASITTTTDTQGIAAVAYTLGKQTKDNPAFKKLTTEANSTQVGENIIDAQLPSGTSITKPFTVYGKPGKADHITAIYPPNGIYLTGDALSSAGFVSSAVQDADSNPISNVTVTFTVSDEVKQQLATNCPWSVDSRNTYLIPAGAACLVNAPTWGACGLTSQQTITALTDYTGAAAQLILGGTQNAIYTINATAPVSGPQNTAEFKFHTYAISCSDVPVHDLKATYTYASDVYGNNLNAGKPDTTIPVRAKLYYLVDEAGNGHFETIPNSTTDLISPSLTFATISGKDQGKGVFTADYPLAKGVNIITISGTATINTPSGPVTKTASTSMTAYGVEIATQPLPLMLINEQGFLSSNQTFTYTITPTEYWASTAFVMIYKDGNVVAQIPTEKQGTDTASISRGFQFDPNSKYEAEVVLNYGTGVEIRGSRVNIPVAQLRVLTDESFPKEVDETKFSDGSDHSNGTKKYHIEIKSQAWSSSCEILTGRIVTLSTATATAGQPVGTPQNTGSDYASQYPLHFNIIDSHCVPRITDTVDGNSYKDKFIISNRPRTELDVGFPSNVNKTAVLYAGIGNILMIEVGGVQKVLPIEPVGVVILGIDGLRQDVLYNPEEQQVNPPGQTSPYYVGPAQLNGLCEVLGGKKDLLLPCNSTGWDNRHIKFQNVTAIFPSITFASWASIFTGKLPKETGITGNEFFARDIFADATDATPGLYMLPKGMITLDADGGAFRPLVEIGFLSSREETKSLPFILNHIMPAEFSGFGYQTPTNKKAVSAPNSVLQTAPFWAEINNLMNKRYHVSSTGDDKCGSSQYECRTVSMFNQYSRGASRHIYSDGVDWWGTPSKYSTELKAIFTSLSVPDILDTAAVMDKSAAAESIGFIDGYFSQSNQDGKRKRFPGVFSIYLSGLDHEAHVHGLGGYKNYFIETVDSQIKDIVKALKDKDEFDSKIFIIVSDHGHTAMPTDLTYIQEVPMQDVETQEPYVVQFVRQAEMSCTLKTNFVVNSSNDYEGKNARNAELENNNLHIWELGEIFKTVGKFTGGSFSYRVLAPYEIATLYSEENYGARATLLDANVIAALNGPMAHIYVTDQADLGKVAEIFKLMMQGEYKAEANSRLGLSEKSYKDLKSTVGRLKTAIDKILVRVKNNYCVFDTINDDGSPKCLLGDPLSTQDYADAWTRIDGMNHPDRSGDIALIMKDATTGSASDRYTTAYACKSWHGSLNPSDSYVPLIISYPGGNKNEVENILKKDTVCNADYGNCNNNWKLPSIVRGIISEQYK